MSASRDAPPVSFQRHPGRYRHWRMELDGNVAWLVMDVDERAGLRPGYELKLNSYDLGVDIELYDAVQRLRFEHPEVGAVVIASGKEKVFCAGANIQMLAQASHPWKVNFCKFTNETRLAIEDATEHSGQTYIAAVGGTASGGGYELALACERILLVDDRSAAVSLPEVPLLGVLPGTGGLTRLTDKRKVRRDLADVFTTKAEGVQGKTAVDWGLVDEAVPRSAFAEAVRDRAAGIAAESPRTTRPQERQGVELTPLRPEITDDAIRYRYVAAEFDRTAGLATIAVRVPRGEVPASIDGVHELGADFWPLTVTRELDDVILWLRTNELELGTWVIKTRGDADDVLAFDRLLAEQGADDWLAGEIRHYLKRTLKRLDVTSRSLIALVEPGSCFAGPLLELALACDRQYMLVGLREEDEDDEEAKPAQLALTESNFTEFPMASGLSRLASRFYGHQASLDRLREQTGRRIDAEEAEELGLVTLALDDIDWDDDVRIALEERASLSPDALTGMEANLRLVGPETMESKIFGRLTAWQNWIFNRPNASGPDGALCRFGTGQRASFDRKRV
ncbi:MAG: benzoyl-CoA-dihydrodiol lyase [Streptosporangiales bacterium]|nr:benzoyl-CoA-dihydrodiol lyase [Streptosporangiales bacterium]